MKKEFYKEYIAPTVVLVGICLIVTFLLAYVNSITAPIIEENKAKAASNARAVVLEGASDFKDITSELTLVSGVTEVYEAGNGKGLVITVGYQGFGGIVTEMVGITNDGKVAGVQILSHSETQGLGTKAMSSDYLGQFVGLDSLKNTTGTVDGTVVDTFTGATYSSGAIIDGISAALVQYGVYGGASYEAPVEKTPEEIKAEAIETACPGGQKVEGELAERVVEVYQNGEGKLAVYVESAGYHALENPKETINLVIGVSGEGKVEGIYVVSHNETKGIGSVCLEDGFLSQFIGAKAITMKSVADEGQTKVDMITEATYSSEGVYYAVKAALQQYALIK